MPQAVKNKRILIGINFMDSARDAFYAGLRIAVQDEAEVFVIHVAEAIRSFDLNKKRYVETKEVIERVEEGIRWRIDELWSEGGSESIDRRKVHGSVEVGKPSAVILEMAKEKDIDLIVLGSSATGGKGSELGHTAERVMRDAPCSVYIVRVDR
tara:strand:+ start:276 stop:737 length:462 start_codon:yes stop_codon:yes gene_type:complete